MASEINLLDVVALLHPMPSAGLVAGQVGTVVEELEVEFSDDDGRTHAQLPVAADDLMVLHYSPVEAA